MLETLAIFVTGLTGVYFIALGLASLFMPAKATRFFQGFATTAADHYTEMSIRLLIGAALIIAAPRLLYAQYFAVFGWILVITSAVLIVLPWRWHQRFAERVMPPFTRYLFAIGLCCLTLGAVTLLALVRAVPA